MFDDYKESQFLAYSLIINSIKNNKVSHAYLIDGNNFDEIDSFIMSFVKLLLCPFNYSNFNKCDCCNICNRIDNGNFTELSIIKPINNVIKKEQLKDLQEEFSMSSIEGNKKIYVIWYPEFMNSYSANSILKFLEEPNDNIIAILVTANVSAILPTIVSRCQYLKLSNNFLFSSNTELNIKKVFKSFNFKDEGVDYLDLFNVCLDFINIFEESGIDILLNLKKIWYNKIVERSYYNFCFQLIIYFYYDVLKYKIFDSVDFYFDYMDNIISVANLLNVSDVLNRIDVYLKYYDLLKFNLNLNLLMDRLIIELGELL